MPDPGSPTLTARDYVVAKNRRDAVKKAVLVHPTLNALYSAGPSDDGKAGWINAIRDQREPVYRLLFYLDRLPIAEDYRDHEVFELLYGNIDDRFPNFQRVLFTTTGGINLITDEMPGLPFAAAIKTNSLEIVPLSMERDLRTAHLIEHGFAYVCAFDEARQGLRILDLKDYHEIFVSRDKAEIQVRNEETIIVGDTQFVRPFLLKYVVKRAEQAWVNPSHAAGEMLDE